MNEYEYVCIATSLYVWLNSEIYPLLTKDPNPSPWPQTLYLLPYASTKVNAIFGSPSQCYHSSPHPEKNGEV